MLARLGFASRAPDDPAQAALAGLRRAWQRGEQLSTARLLLDYPELAERQSAVLELAYEEAHLRLEAGEEIDWQQMSDSLPGYASQVRRALSMARFLGDHPDLLAGSPPPATGPIEWPLPGDTVSGFELVSHLGRGGFARVYLARERSLGGRLVAVKLSPEGPAEAETLAKLRHANIVPVYSVHADAATGLTLTCMPYLGRATLADLLARVRRDRRLPMHAHDLRTIVAELNGPGHAESLPRDENLSERTNYVDGIVNWAAQLADALEHAHLQGICHRDLKPSNVLLTAGGKAMLLDFNLSQEPLAALNRVGGTLPYMAPEQIQSMLIDSPTYAAPADPRSDLFSLGVVLFELLAGSPAFGPLPTSDGPEDLDGHLDHNECAAHWWQLCRQGPRSLRRLNPRIDAELARLVEGLLAFDPANRVQTAARAAAGLRRCLRSRRRLVRWSLAHRGTLAYSAAALALALVAGGYSLVGHRQAGERLSVAQEQLQAGDANGAIASLGAAADDQRDWKFYALRGRAFSMLGDYRAAIESLAEAQRGHDSAQVAAALGDCQLADGRFEHALSSYERAIALGFESAGLANNLGVVLLQRWERPQADRWFCRALELDDRLQAALFNRARLAYVVATEARQKPPTQAIDDIEAAIAVGPASDAVYLLAAKICHARADDDRREQGLAYLREAIRLGLDLPDAQRAGIVREMVEVLRQRGDLDAALETGARVPRSEPPIRADSLAGASLDWAANPSDAE